MPTDDAEVLDNWMPGTNKVTARKGYTQYTTGVGSGNVDLG
jgi:hypothetical protein